MTKKELIEALERYDDDMPVYVRGWTGVSRELTSHREVLGHIVLDPQYDGD